MAPRLRISYNWPDTEPWRACHRTDVRFSVTARMNHKIIKMIARIDEDAWTPIKYPHATFDEDEQRWICPPDATAEPGPPPCAAT